MPDLSITIEVWVDPPFTHYEEKTLTEQLFDAVEFAVGGKKMTLQIEEHALES